MSFGSVYNPASSRHSLVQGEAQTMMERVERPGLSCSSLHPFKLVILRAVTQQTERLAQPFFNGQETLNDWYREEYSQATVKCYDIDCVSCLLRDFFAENNFYC